jgi:hypothetical protein
LNFYVIFKGGLRLPFGFEVGEHPVKFGVVVAAEGEDSVFFDSSEGVHGVKVGEFLKKHPLRWRGLLPLRDSGFHAILLSQSLTQKLLHEGLHPNLLPGDVLHVVVELLQGLAAGVPQQVIGADAPLRLHSVPAESEALLAAAGKAALQLPDAVLTGQPMGVAVLEVAPAEGAAAPGAVEVLDDGPESPVDVLPVHLFLPQEHHKVIQLPLALPHVGLLSFSSEIDVSVVRCPTLDQLKLLISQNHFAVFAVVK